MDSEQNCLNDLVEASYPSFMEASNLEEQHWVRKLGQTSWELDFKIVPPEKIRRSVIVFYRTKHLNPTKSILFYYTGDLNLR